MNVIRPLYAKWQHLVHEVAKFGVVGAVAYVIDVGLFNLLHLNAGWDVLLAKTVSTIVAATVAYFGNRHWSFTHRARTGLRREYSIFVVLTAVGLGITLAVLGFARYVLHVHSAVGVNIWGNVIGTGLATVFRFWAYKKYVFLAPDHPKVRQDPPPVVLPDLPDLPEPTISPDSTPGRGYRLPLGT